MNERLAPIPTPPSQLWRQLRLQYVPVVVFVAGVVAAAILWRHWVAPPSLVAEAEAIRADVRSSHIGTLTNVKVSLFQPVKAGEVIAELTVTDPRVLESSLAVIRAELDTIRFTMDPVMSQQRAALDYERLLLDLMKARVDLAQLQAQLYQAESNFTRTSALFDKKLVTEEKFEEMKNARDSLAAQTKAQNELISRIEPGLQKFVTEGPGGQIPSPADGLRAAIKVQEEKLKLTTAQLGPVALVAPIDGVITLVYHQPGETVPAGQPIFQISATRVERIVGYLRPPLGQAPTPGTTVELRTRSMQRQIAQASVTQVGKQWEPISPTLLAAMRLPVSTTPTEFGLRVLITPPAGLTLRPGEHVDVIFKSN